MGSPPPSSPQARQGLLAPSPPFWESAACRPPPPPNQAPPPSSRPSPCPQLEPLVRAARHTKPFQQEKQKRFFDYYLFLFFIYIYFIIFYSFILRTFYFLPRPLSLCLSHQTAIWNNMKGSFGMLKWKTSGNTYDSNLTFLQQSILVFAQQKIPSDVFESEI